MGHQQCVIGTLSRHILIKQEILLRFSGSFVPVILEIRAQRHTIVHPQQPPYSPQRPGSLFPRTEKDVEDPFRLDHDAQVGRVSRLALLVGGRLDDDEGGNPGEAETPFVGVDGLGELGGPGVRVEGAEGLEEAPVDVLIVLDGPSVRREFASDDEGSVGAQLAGLR